MLIKNKKDLALTPLREQALEIIESGIDSALPENLIKPVFIYNAKLNTATIARKEYSLIKGRIFIIGGGKASGKMAEALEKIIGPDNIAAGAVNTAEGEYRTEKIKIIEAEHPFPGKKGLKGAEKILRLKDKHSIGKKDLVICLISGGGSAMLPGPAAGISLEDKQAATGALIKSGAEIREINAVRKHLSRVKGGRLALYFAPARVASLIISDVVGNDLSVIASGPTAPDPTTFNDAMMVLEKYKLLNIIPESVLNHIKQGCDNKVEDTPKELNNADNFIIGKNAIALEAMAHKAREYGYKPLIVSHELAGNPETAALQIAKEINSGKYIDYDVLLYGGETSPNILEGAGQPSFAKASEGKGGRNQHFTAAIMLALADCDKDWLVAGVGTDGEDFNTGAAGAIADNLSLKTALGKGLDIKKYLDSFDSYNFFKKLGNSQIITGPTGTNVGDVAVIIKK